MSQLFTETGSPPWPGTSVRPPLCPTDSKIWIQRENMQENPPVCPAAQTPTHLISYPTLPTLWLAWQKGFSVDKASFWGEFVDSPYISGIGYPTPSRNTHLS